MCCCGALSSSLKRCTACKEVYYCGVGCQRSHHKYHRNECKKRSNSKDDLLPSVTREYDKAAAATEISDWTIGWEPPEREDCPICMDPLPLIPKYSTYKSCCGQLICEGCRIEAQGKSQHSLCPFCREQETETEELVERLETRVAKNDPRAMMTLSGTLMRINPSRNSEVRSLALIQKAAGLGLPIACGSIGMMYYTGCDVLPRDVTKAEELSVRAAKGNDPTGLRTLAMIESDRFNVAKSTRLTRLAAAVGDKEAIELLKRLYRVQLGEGIVTKDELAASLRAFHAAQKEMEGPAREKHRDAIKARAVAY